jgi:hypothetical protein
VSFLKQIMKFPKIFVAILHFKELENYPYFFDIIIKATVVFFRMQFEPQIYHSGTEMPTIKGRFFT